ncbi:MAG: hypothetical protein QGF59_26960 [Pirellulaceae bacterium]|nr:hypothetical protein [Pirellulaceae bacterium]
MLKSLRPYLKLEIALAALVLIATAASAYFFQERNSKQDETEDLQRRIILAEDDLSATQFDRSEVASTLEVKRQELDGQRQALEVLLTSTTSSVSFATRQQALDLSGQLVDYAASRNLDLGNFETTQATTTVGTFAFPSITYQLVVIGRPSFLIGMLSIINDVPTTEIDTLQLVNNANVPGQWVMTVDVSVLYSQQGSVSVSGGA